MGVKRLRFPVFRRDFRHAHEAAKLFRQLSERAVTFLQAVIASLFGRILIDANAAAAHLVHHRQQIDVETIGGAGALAVEDRIEPLK